MNDNEQDMGFNVEETEAETAFRRSDDHYWRGNKLEPFSFVRKTAAQFLGLRYWKLTQDDLETLTNPRRARLPELLEKIEQLKNGGSIEDLQSAQESLRELEQEPEEIQVYDAIAYDAAIVLWLCSQPDAKCREARKRPKAFEAEIDKWAEANGIFLEGTANANGEALAVFMQIVNDITISEGSAVESGSPNQDSDPN